MRELFVLILLLLGLPANAQVIDAMMHHLRHGAQREWDDFSEKAESRELRVSFSGKANATEKTLRLRHRDLRHVWKVSLNGNELAKLPQDDNLMVSFIAVPPGAVREGANEIRVVCTEKSDEPDDIEVGDIELLDVSRKEHVSKAAVDVSVVDAESDRPIPWRLTIVDGHGALVPLGIKSDLRQAVRAGVVYSADGRAKLKLPAGDYTLYAGRGFEWGIDSVKLHLKAGENGTKQLAIRREVDTSRLVAADTHIHTFTFSRHGDATLAERMVTLAGEGIELPIATDHNLSVDYEEAALAAGVRGYFTPVIGNEVTTAKLGHFNVFPIDKARPLIDFRAPTWEKLFDNIDRLAPGAIVILNHARDDHGGFRPFDPVRHISLTGEDMDGQVLRANAMEVINSGATLNDPLLLYRDWMGCLNRGLKLTPVGASDSHDVSRFIVGQGRTYIRTGDADVGKIDVAAACEAIKRGRVLVSYGLLVDMKVNDRFGPGELATSDGEVSVEVKILGPSWTRADRVELYANGVRIREAQIGAEHAARVGLKSTIVWRLPPFKHDVFLTAIATGPGVTSPYWPGAKPYQRTSPHWVPYVLGCTGAIYLDADGSGKFESAFDYAGAMVDLAKGDVAVTLKRLEGFDMSTCAQAASILRRRGAVKTPQSLEEAAAGAAGKVREGWLAYAQAWGESETAGAKKVQP